MAEVNQQLIADRLGISKATVSRCFTNHAGISPVTRAKVFQLASELGYSHNESRSPTSKNRKSKLKFTVLICSEKEEFYNGDYQSPGEQILAGVSEYALTADASVEIKLVSPQISCEENGEVDKIIGIKDRKNRGVLLIYPFPPDVVDQLAVKYPVVSLVDQHDLNTIDCVDVNHFDGISRIVEHLVDSGHQKIGFYTKNYPVEASWSFRRYSAFIEKMTRLKLKVASSDVIGVFPRRNYTLEQSYDEAMKRTEAGVTAWVCAADHQAYDLITSLKDRGLKVPEDVSITGFDGIWRSGSGSGEFLTTIDIPYREIGMTGAERLARRLNKRFREKQHIYISGKLHQGETTGKAG